jgi:CubicO group peptidase (beta-lactamase class C family)
MKKQFLILLALFLTYGCGSSSFEATPVSTGSTLTQTESAFQQAVLDSFEAQELPAVAAGLWQPGRPPFLLLLGEANKENGRAPTSTDGFRVGSVTKSFTVTLILQLAEEGALSLEDPIGKYIPNIQNPNATLEQLANMTSGIFNYTENQQFVELFVEDFARVWTSQQLIQYANDGSPYFLPGLGWHYSNTNTVALGMVVEEVTGNSLAQEIRARLATPLDLRHTVYPPTADMPTPYAAGYAVVDVGEVEEFTRTHPSSSAGSGALVSTLDDLAVWGRALGRGELLSKESFNRQIQMIPTDSCPTCPEYDGYGMGIGELNGWLGHTGDYIGYQALVMYDPLTEATVVILVNQKDFTRSVHYPTDMFRDFVRVHGG